MTASAHRQSTGGKSMDGRLHTMNFVKRLRDSLRLKKRIVAQATRPFAGENAPTKEIERVNFPAIRNSMVRCSGARKHALLYEDQFYSRFL